MMQPGDNLSLGWARLIIEELWRLGLRDLCFAPGSRSAPLTLAASQHGRLRCHSHFDERGLGFLALGLAKRSARPVALVTTSGTAVANLYPAVIEARQSGVPLIVLSADRPPELIDCGANQAIPQVGIFAGYPVFSQNLPTPTSHISPRFLLGTLDQLWLTLTQNPGPAHLNCPFAEPLYPHQGEPLPTDWLDELAHWPDGDEPLTRIQPVVSAVPLQVDWPQWASRRGVVVAGQIDSPEEALAVAELADHLGWPLLADAQSQLLQHPGAIAHADLALHDTTFGQELARAELLLPGVLGDELAQALGEQAPPHLQQQFGARQLLTKWRTMQRQIGVGDGAGMLQQLRLGVGEQRPAQVSGQLGHRQRLRGGVDLPGDYDATAARPLWPVHLEGRGRDG